MVFNLEIGILKSLIVKGEKGILGIVWTPRNILKKMICMVILDDPYVTHTHTQKKMRGKEES